MIFTRSNASCGSWNGIFGKTDRANNCSILYSIPPAIDPCLLIHLDAMNPILLMAAVNESPAVKLI
jgi:hypothetical protein